MKRFYCLTIGLAFTALCFAQQIPANPNNRRTDTASKRTTSVPCQILSKAIQGSNYRESGYTITDCLQCTKWKTNGISKLPDSLFNREILAITRFVKSPAGSRSYGGEKVNEQTIRWEKGPQKISFYA